MKKAWSHLSLPFDYALRACSGQALTLAQQGPPGHAHGVPSTAVLDEVMGAAVWQVGYMVAAAKIDVNYRKPVP